MGLLALSALAGCGGEDTSSRQAGGTSSQPSTSASTPEVPPADGPLLKLKTTQVNVPRGWTRDAQIIGNQESAGAGASQLIIYESGAVSGDDLDAQVRFKVRNSETLPKDAERAENVELDGVEAWTLEGHASESQYEYRWGTETDTRRVEITLSVDSDMSKEKRDALAASILASFQWTSD